MCKYRLGMPYFKDKNLFSCPYNEDYYKMKANNELPLQLYYKPRLWTESDKKKLATAVYGYICRSKKLELEKVLVECRKAWDTVITVHLQQEVEYLGNEEMVESVIKMWAGTYLMEEEVIVSRKEELCREISELREQLDKIEDGVLKKEIAGRILELNGEKDTIIGKNYIVKVASEWDKYIDWLDISINMLQERHTDSECKFLWENYMNPKFSKKAWSMEENAKLTTVVAKFNMENWEAIASQMSLKKSAYQCCIHFFSKLWEKCRRDKWTVEEEEYLKSVVDICRIGDYIPWSKVTKYFTDRNRTQIYNHYLLCLNPYIKKGKFSITEDILLTALMKKYQSFVKASYYFPNRQVSQLRDRFKSMGETLRSWTVEDDIKILKHVEQFGDKHWGTINIDKNAALIRHRYNIIQKWILLNPGKSIVGIDRRTKSFTLRNQQYERHRVIKCLTDILLKQSSEENPENIFNIKYIEKLVIELGEGKHLKKTKPVTKATYSNIYKELRSDVESILRDSFECAYRFVGRSRTINQEVIDKSTERVKYGLNMLNAKLNIPDLETLKNNPLLDELDLEILTKLHFEQKPLDNKPVFPTKIIDQNISNLPPEPGTLIGFRGIMIYNETLKSISKGHYSDSKLLDKNNESTYGIKHSRQLIDEQLEKITNKEQTIHERQIFERRFKSLFKWPAIMSLPENEPSDPFNDLETPNLPQLPPKPEVQNNISKLNLNNSAHEAEVGSHFLDFSKVTFPAQPAALLDLPSDMRLSPGMSTSKGTEVSKKPLAISLSKKRGRPSKVSPKVVKMIEAKRKKRNSSNVDELTTEKPPKKFRTEDP